jgi:Ohr subfamily peroxiredoxin
MMNPLYTAQARVHGGRELGHGRSSDGRVDVALRQPVELGGDGDGANPEQLFAIGYAACFSSSLALVARRRRITVDDVVVDAKVMLFPAEHGGYRLGVELHITIDQITDPSQAVELAQLAHQVCPYSNATRGNIDVLLVVNGTDLRMAA